MIGEVGGCTAELLARGQQVPEHFADGEDLMRHDRTYHSVGPTGEEADGLDSCPGEGRYPRSNSSATRDRKRLTV